MDSIRRTAGAPGRGQPIPVCITKKPGTPPTLQFVKQRNLYHELRGGGLHGGSHRRHARRVIVSADWIQRAMPEFWGRWVALRLMYGSEVDQYVPRPLEDK